MNTGRYAGHVLSIPMYLILTIVTCGIFNLYWNFPTENLQCFIALVLPVVIPVEEFLWEVMPE